MIILKINTQVNTFKKFEESFNNTFNNKINTNNNALIQKYLNYIMTKIFNI